MDPQDNQELPHGHDDLSEAIHSFREWWIKHGMRTMVMVLIAMLALFVYRMKKNSDRIASDNAWFDLSAATSPESYHAVAREHDIKAVQILAHLRAGDAALVKSLGGGDPAAALTQEKKPQLPMTQEERERLLVGAHEDYQAVVKDETAPKVYRLNALLGLASVAESMGKWDEARGCYDSILDRAGDEYQAITAQAKGRRALLERVAIPVTFAPEPVMTRVIDPAVKDETIDTTSPAATQPAGDETPLATDAAGTADAAATDAAPAKNDKPAE